MSPRTYYIARIGVLMAGLTRRMRRVKYPHLVSRCHLILPASAISSNILCTRGLFADERCANAQILTGFGRATKFIVSGGGQRAGYWSITVLKIAILIKRLIYLSPGGTFDVLNHRGNITVGCPICLI